MSDWIALILSFVYVFAVLGIAEGLRSWRSYGPEFTRKLVHLGVGMWSVGTVLLFESVWIALIPPAVFIILNYLSYRFETFKAMEVMDKSNLGTVYFPIAFCGVIILFWPVPDLIVAALMPLTWGDAMASVLGRYYGHLEYTILGHTRTIEGSLSMLIFSFLSVFLALIFLPPLTSVWLSAGLALGIAVITTLVEAISPWGLDNLTVTVAAGGALFLWTMVF